MVFYKIYAGIFIKIYAAIFTKIYVVEKKNNNLKFRD